MNLTLKGALAALNAAKDATMQNTVSEEILIHRAAVCGRCPKKRPLRGTTSRISAVLGYVTGKHRVPKQLAESMCGVCGCSLLLLLPATDENLHQDSPEESKQRPDQCWIKRKQKQ